MAFLSLMVFKGVSLSENNS